MEADPENVVGETFQVSFGKEYTAKEILKECMNSCGLKVKVIEKGYRPGEKRMREHFDTSKARRVLGYSPKVSLREGLKMTVEWTKSLER